MNPTFAELLLQEYGVSQPEDIDLEAIAFDQGATIRYRQMDSCEAQIIGHGKTAIINKVATIKQLLLITGNPQLDGIFAKLAH